MTSTRGCFAARFLNGLFAAAVSASFFGPIAVGQPAELLNSERIERTFGSYGIEVLESSAIIRVSNLYSRNGAHAVCRTFAVVRYPTEVDPAFATEHRAILDGGSIGAVFATAGWRVEKTHGYYGEVEAAGRAAALMNVAVGTPLAVHVYTLHVAKNGGRFRYATIAEIHHPEYLAVDDLRAIYGPLSADEAAEAREMLALAQLEMR